MALASIIYQYDSMPAGVSLSIFESVGHFAAAVLMNPSPLCVFCVCFIMLFTAVITTHHICTLINRGKVCMHTWLFFRTRVRVCGCWLLVGVVERRCDGPGKA